LLVLKVDTTIQKQLVYVLDGSIQFVLLDIILAVILNLVVAKGVLRMLMGAIYLIFVLLVDTEHSRKTAGHLLVTLNGLAV
jgi:hypothetical protein